MKKITPVKKYLLIALVISFVFLAIYFKRGPTDKKTSIQIKGASISVELANTDTKRARGLMFRNRLEKDEGMLFIFDDERRHSFWMKNTYIPLDIIWLNSKKEVVHIEHSAPPCKENPCPTYSTDQPALYVLELNGGWSIEHNLNIGDTVSF